jgi:hypothetical protein
LKSKSSDYTQMCSASNPIVCGLVMTEKPAFLSPQVTANDADVDRPNNIIYFLTGPGINAENPAESNFDINKATGEIFVLKVSERRFGMFSV